MNNILNLNEAAKRCGVTSEIILTFIHEEWIVPVDQSLDEEDIARIRLIRELQEEFGVNDESIPIILNLLDQLYRMHIEVKKSSA